MKNKATLVLIEQAIMLPVFAFAATLCLAAFVWANKTSAEDAVINLASVQAQSAAEVLKACGGDMEEAAEIFGGTWNGQSWTVCYNEQWMQDADGQYMLTAASEEESVEYLGAANICVYREEVCLVSLGIAWQEDGVYERE